MKTMLEELKSAELSVTNACGHTAHCADCPLNIGADSCVLTVLQHAIKVEYVNELRRQCGEVI